MKVALLTRGDTELSWAIIRKLNNIPEVNLRVFVTKKSRNRRVAELYYRMSLKLRLRFRQRLLGEHHPEIEIPPVNNEGIYSGDINSDSNLEILKEFKPDVMVISGTKLVKNQLLETAKLAVNIHHGFLPIYRGVSSVDWVINERNYNYFYVMLHQAESRLDAGRVIVGSYVTPYLKESLTLFTRRLYLSGADLVERVIRQWPNVELVSQPEMMPVRIYRHRCKGLEHGKQVSKNYYTRNMERYTFLQYYRPYLQRLANKSSHKGVVSKGKRLIAKNIIKSLTRKELAPGLYILTYHDICSNQMATYFAENGVPLIFTSETNFLSHVKYLSDKFLCVSLDKGLELWRQGHAESERIVCVTFDDGLLGVTSILTELSETELIPTLFLCSDPLLNNKPLGVHKELLTQHYNYIQGVDVNDIGIEFGQILKEGFNETSDFSNFAKSRYLDANTTRDLLDRQLVSSVGSHSRDHTSLAGDGIQQQRAKILDAHQSLREQFGENLKYFSFPFGKLDRMAYSSEFIAHDMAKCVFQCNGGINQNSNAVGSILRIGIPDGGTEMLDQLLRIQWVR